MANKLYYTVEKELQTINTIEECTGWKNVIVYEIANDRPKAWFELTIKNKKSTEKNIHKWLKHGGFFNRNYDLVLL
jgi:hypothetical protein